MGRGRGRPRLYKTAEEKANANRAKSRRSYYKRKAALAPSHKGSNSRYRADTSRSDLLNEAAKDNEMISTDPTDIMGWISLVTATGEHFDSFIKASPRRYFDLLCSQYRASYRTEIFSDDLVEIRAFHSTMERCNAAILQLAGVGRELRASQDRERQVQETLKCLEELECYASIGKAEVIEMQRNRQLMYQSLPY